MRSQILVFLILCVVSSIVARGPPPSTTDDTDDSSTDSTTSYETAVTALLDAGTCASVDANSDCGDDAESFYETFEYTDSDDKEWRVIVISGAPDHEAETTLLIDEDDGGYWNPNTRCERWQYAKVPLTPEKSTDTIDWDDVDTYPFYGMGAFGYASSGAVFFDTRSDEDGSTAWDNEIDTLDVSMGHSNNAYQYHYHGVPYYMTSDTKTANDTGECQFLGYMMDGYPIYGRCLHTDGTELESCWEADIDDPWNLGNYTYTNDDACNLDGANGYDFTGQTSDSYTGYGYVTTTEFSGVPIGLMGSEFGTICGFTP